MTTIAPSQRERQRERDDQEAGLAVLLLDTPAHAAVRRFHERQFTSWRHRAFRAIQPRWKPDRLLITDNAALDAIAQEAEVPRLVLFDLAVLGDEWASWSNTCILIDRLERAFVRRWVQLHAYQLAHLAAADDVALDLGWAALDDGGVLDRLRDALGTPSPNAGPRYPASAWRRTT